MVFFCVFVLLLNQFCGIHWLLTLFCHLCKIERFAKPEVNGYCNSHKDADISHSPYYYYNFKLFRFFFFFFNCEFVKWNRSLQWNLKAGRAIRCTDPITRSFHDKSLQASSNEIVLCGKIVWTAKVNRGSQRVVHKWTEHKGGQRLFQQNNERFSKSIMNPGSINLVWN